MIALIVRRIIEYGSWWRLNEKRNRGKMPMYILYSSTESTVGEIESWRGLRSRFDLSQENASLKICLTLTSVNLYTHCRNNSTQSGSCTQQGLQAQIFFVFHPTCFRSCSGIPALMRRHENTVNRQIPEPCLSWQIDPSRRNIAFLNRKFSCLKEPSVA